MRRFLFIVLAAGLLVAAPSAALDRKPPRIVGAQMVDADRDGKADRVRLTYSERIRHALDKNRFPFTVVGYKIKRVNRASRKTLVILLVEQAAPDPTAAPAVRYKRTTKQPVRDRAGNQARKQTFRGTKPWGAASAGGIDGDRDGWSPPADCNDSNAAIYPGAADKPDLAFVDSNCDGIDGTEADAIFASPLGDNGNLGTKASPKREIQAAVAAAAAAGKDVYAAGGSYSRVDLASGVGIYGGYGSNWSRTLATATSITGTPQGVLGIGDTNVLLQHLTVRGERGGGASAYGVHLASGSSAMLQRVLVSAGDGLAAGARPQGGLGGSGGPGGPGMTGACDDNTRGTAGGPGGSGARLGGSGGIGGHADNWDGGDGGEGQFGTAGGAGGDNDNPGDDGDDGDPGDHGSSGPSGEGGTASVAAAAGLWVGQGGAAGGSGTPGHGGGGGGGGGAQECTFCFQGAGNGGGGGGGAGGGGGGGLGGFFGGGSFGLYLHNSTVTVSDASSITAGNGGTGGRGGDAGFGGPGGDPGLGPTDCTSQVGEGGNGGRGGDGGPGGAGGGGAGGPSIGIFRAGSSPAPTVTDSTVANGTPGLGGPGGDGVINGGTGATGIAAPIYPAP